MTSPEPKGTGSHRTGPEVTENRKSRVLGRETAEQFEKGSWAEDGAKPRRNAGAESKVQFKHRGRSLTPKNKKK